MPLASPTAQPVILLIAWENLLYNLFSPLFEVMVFTHSSWPAFYREFDATSNLKCSSYLFSFFTDGVAPASFTYQKHDYCFWLLSLIHYSNARWFLSWQADFRRVCIRSYRVLNWIIKWVQRIRRGDIAFLHLLVIVEN